MAMRVAIIGGGAFGAATAVKLAEHGFSICVFERLPGLMQGTTSVANRLHRGFHYPRDEQTARQCIRGFHAFRENFEAAVLPGVFNAYFIANEGSLTSPEDFLSFCRRLSLPYREIGPDEFLPPVTNVSLGILTGEVMYDPLILNSLLKDRLCTAKVEQRFNADVIDIRRKNGGYEIITSHGSSDHFDAVVNCCYADSNRLTARLGHSVQSRQYEYVAASIIELDLPQTVSISVLDGPFMCMLPFGAGGEYLLYHVEQGVIAQDTTEFIDRNWLSPETSPFAGVNKQQWFDAQLASCCTFIPALKHCRLKKFVQCPRVVLADSDDTDARQSILTEHEPGYIGVFSGKVNHSVWVADEIAEMLGTSVAEPLSQPGC